MQTTKRKANEMPPDPPARRFLAGRQLIFEGIAPGTTKEMIADYLHVYKLVDDNSLNDLESAVSLRRTILVTLTRGHSAQEVAAAISRLSGTILNGNALTLSLFGTPASQTIQRADPQISGPLLSSHPGTPHPKTRRMTRAETRRRSVMPSHPPPTLPSQSNNTEREPFLKQEQASAVIVKQEPVETPPEDIECFSEEQVTRDSPPVHHRTKDQGIHTLRRNEILAQGQSSGTTAPTPSSSRSRKRRVRASFWGQDRTDHEGLTSRGT